MGKHHDVSLTAQHFAIDQGSIAIEHDALNVIHVTNPSIE
ncbi:CbbY family protein [Yersinia mollaretii ATCC 43969]|uniref:CbbY family protein n=1 Tax=Yersinia mollaretii (strain ATCC 43969 / DSM 18520 / CIP 103324 / CNY 7263 / WAIP 204) TaxID=349967 RepID=A0ABM9Y8D6_YERMW|nr:CbbY family protein [Yersinia mollaretii ATCC 43969]